MASIPAHTTRTDRYRRTVGRGAVQDSKASLRIDRQAFRDIEGFINSAYGSAARMEEALDLLVRYFGLTIKGMAQKKSKGPIAPGRVSNPALAFQVPVQRITGRYFAGWQMRRIVYGRWLVFNAERAAFVVEHNIFATGRRVRRPILKLSVIQALRFIQTTGVANHFASAVFAPRRNSSGQFQSFKVRMSGSSVFGMAGPSGKLPG